MNHLAEHLHQALQQVVGYIYPNEVELHWGLLIVIYPYVTGLVAGAFILASLERVFNIRELKPTYRLSLVTALAFLFVAPLPLLSHLGHPERAFEIFLTPQLKSAMAMFGFVYIWYLMIVLLLEIWFDYRKDFVLWSKTRKGWSRYMYSVLTLGSTDLSERALAFDRKAGKIITIIGIPSAFLLHGYVGFIFGSVKANPWWSSVLIPIVFLFSAIVSGIAMMILVYAISTMLRRKTIDIACMDKLATFLIFAIILDVSLELLDFVHRLYESEESIHIIGQMVSSRLFQSLVIIQLILGSLLPLVALVVARYRQLPAAVRSVIYFESAILIQLGIFSTRWNVVIGGQLFSKSFRGLTVYKVQLFGIEGLLVSLGLLILPFIILFILIKIIPPWLESEARVPASGAESSE